MSTGHIYSPSHNAVKTSVPLMYLTFFFRISFSKRKLVALAKEHIKTTLCYTLFVILTRQHNSPSPPFSFHHIKYFQQNLSTPENPAIDRFTAFCPLKGQPKDKIQLFCMSLNVLFQNLYILTEYNKQ